MLDIKIKYVLDIKPIEVSDTGDWIDLRAGKDVELEEFQYAQIPLGVCMQIPRVTQLSLHRDHLRLRSGGSYRSTQ